MKLWPTPEDQIPRQTRFWVSRVSGGIVPTHLVAETPEATQQRLEEDFPLFKALNVGKRALVNLVERNSNEI